MNTNHAILEAYLAAEQDSETLLYRRDYPLTLASTFRIGGNAAYAVWPRSVKTLCSLLSFFRENKIYHAVFGNASNVLFSDEGFDGAVIFTTNLRETVVDKTQISVECGASVTQLSSVAARAGLGGLEFAYGIPGTLGGAVFMNAGAYGGEIKDVVKKAFWYDTVTGQTGWYTDGENCFSYRTSVYQTEPKIILSAELTLKERNPEQIRAEMKDYMERRRDKQPLEFPSAGSTFKRYPGYFTGKLIEDAGLKGFSVGGAQVSEKHAGFVINRGGATAKEVLELVDLIKAKIFEINGIHLECEIRLVPYSG